MFSVTLPMLWSPAMLDLELWSQLVGIQGNFNTIPCKSAMEHLGSSGHMENVSIFLFCGERQ